MNGSDAGEQPETFFLQLAALDRVIERALADSDVGKGEVADVVFDRLDAKYRAVASNR